MGLYKKIFLFTGVLTTLISMPHKSVAQVIVSDAILEFKNEERLIRSIAVGNASDDKTIHIQAQITEILNPASKNVEHIETQDVFTVPEIFTLKPRSQRAIRLVSNKRPENTERVFRVVFNPSIVKDDLGEGKPSHINLLTTTAVMMILNPPNAKENLTWNRKDGYINFTNNGNTNVVLRSGRYCAKDISCTIKGQRLWSGDAWRLKLPKALIEEDIIL
ncbi:MAG: P pilus assembly chaperone PapD, partial [bacterium]